MERFPVCLRGLGPSRGRLALREAWGGSCLAPRDLGGSGGLEPPQNGWGGQGGAAGGPASLADVKLCNKQTCPNSFEKRIQDGTDVFQISTDGSCLCKVLRRRC